MNKIIWTKRELEEYAKDKDPLKPTLPYAIVGVDKGSASTSQETSEVDGKITNLVVWFPPGNAGLLFASVSVNDKFLTAGLGGDNTYHSLLEAHDIKKGDIVKVMLKNHDSTYWHSIRIRVEVDGLD